VLVLILLIFAYLLFLGFSGESTKENGFWYPLDYFIRQENNKIRGRRGSKPGVPEQQTRPLGGHQYGGEMTW
jgi:hypothetical protein